MKKTFLLLCLCMSFVLVGCGTKVDTVETNIEEVEISNTKQIGTIKVDSSFATLYGAYADGFDTYLNILVQVYNDDLESDLYTKGKDVYEKTIVDFSTFGNEESKEAVECLEEYRQLVNGLANIFMDAKEKTSLTQDQVTQIDDLINKSNVSKEMWKKYYYAFEY